eukprot:281166_1
MSFSNHIDTKNSVNANEFFAELTKTIHQSINSSKEKKEKSKSSHSKSDENKSKKSNKSKTSKISKQNIAADINPQITMTIDGHYIEPVLPLKLNPSTSNMNPEHTTTVSQLHTSINNTTTIKSIMDTHAPLSMSIKMENLTCLSEPLMNDHGHSSADGDSDNNGKDKDIIMHNSAGILTIGTNVIDGNIDFIVQKPENINAKSVKFNCENNDTNISRNVTPNASNNVSPNPSPNPSPEPEPLTEIKDIELTMTKTAITHYSSKTLNKQSSVRSTRSQSSTDTSGAADLIGVMNKMGLLVGFAVICSILSLIGNVFIEVHELETIEKHDIDVQSIWAEILPLMDIVITSLMLYLQFNFADKVYRKLLGNVDVLLL